MSARACSNCASSGQLRKGRCQACYRYWKRTGEERPADELAAARARREHEGRVARRRVALAELDAL